VEVADLAVVVGARTRHKLVPKWEKRR